MQLRKTASGKKVLRMSRVEWERIGKSAQWMGGGPPTNPDPGGERAQMAVDGTVDEMIGEFDIPKEKWGELQDLVGEAMDDGLFKRDGKYYEPLDYEIREQIVEKLRL